MDFHYNNYSDIELIESFGGIEVKGSRSEFNFNLFQRAVVNFLSKDFKKIF